MVCVMGISFLAQLYTNLKCYSIDSRHSALFIKCNLQKHVATLMHNIPISILFCSRIVTRELRSMLIAEPRRKNNLILMEKEK